jgi:hypothetical protein
MQLTHMKFAERRKDVGNLGARRVIGLDVNKPDDSSLVDDEDRGSRELS